MANLTFVDATVLMLYLAGVVGLGIWMGGGRNSAQAYMLGGNDAPWWAILGSIVATETSTVTFLSVPGIAFAEKGDLRFLQLAIGYIAGRTIIALWLLPYYFKGRVFTVYTLLRERFGKLTQRTASAIFLITRNLGDGLRLFLTAVVLEATLDWSLSACVVVIGIATIVFTFFGGMRSVIWNDCIQLVIYMLGGLIALLLIVGRLEGGFAGLFEFAEATGRTRLFDFKFFADGSPRFHETYTFWAGLIGGGFLTLGTHGTDQMLVQRLLAARSQRDASKALIASGCVVFVQFFLFLVVGIALANYYSQNPPDIAFESGDRVLSGFIVHEMPAGVGLIGILLAAIFAAAMSTLSSSLNSSATTVVADWTSKSGGDLDNSTTVLRTQMWTAFFGGIQMGIAIWAASFDDSVISNALAIAGFASGLLLGLFAIGSFIKSANQPVALFGLCTGTLALLIVKFVLPNLPEESAFQYSIAWPWLPVIGSLVTFVAGYIASLVFGSRNQVELSPRNQAH